MTLRQSELKTLTLNNFAARLGITSTTARSWIKRGWLIGATQLPNGRWLIPSSEIDRLTGGRP